MNRIFICTAMIFVSALTCNAQTYSWTDNSGVTHFTDSLETVPSKYRKKIKTGPGITIRDPGIKEEMQLQQQRAIQEEASRPPIVITPDSERKPVQQETKPAETRKQEPPPRTKSQKIRDNIERRRLEEQKAQQSGSTQ